MSLKETKKVAANRYELEILIDGEKFREAIKAAYKQNAKKINVPGFRKGKAPYLFPAVVLYLIGLVLVFFADDNIYYFLLSAVVTIVGYGLLMIMLGAAVRDFTPEDKTGQLQGIRMIFSVLIPMVVGPAIGDLACRHAGATYTNEYGVETIALDGCFYYFCSKI